MRLASETTMFCQDVGSFQGSLIQEKMAIVRQNNLCTKCLKLGHFARKCRLSLTCKKCGQAHHTLLHDEQKKEDHGQPRGDSPLKTDELVMHVSHSCHKQQVLLMTC